MQYRLRPLLHQWLDGEGRPNRKSHDEAYSEGCQAVASDPTETMMEATAAVCTVPGDGEWSHVTCVVVVVLCVWTRGEWRVPEISGSESVTKRARERAQLCVDCLGGPLWAVVKQATKGSIVFPVGFPGICPVTRHGNEISDLFFPVVPLGVLRRPCEVFTITRTSSQQLVSNRLGIVFFLVDLAVEEDGKCSSSEALAVKMTCG